MVYTINVSEMTKQAKSVRAGRAARCIVWCSAQARPPQTLIKALESRGLSLTLTMEAYLAVADVLRAAREDEVVVLVAIEPDELPRFEDVLTTIDRYAPRAARWTYSEHQRQPLQAVTRAHPRTEPAVPPARHQPPVSTSHEETGETKPVAALASEGPMLRLAGLGVLRDAANESMLQSTAADGAHDALRGHSTLTYDEWEALRGTDNDDSAGGGP